MIPKQVFPSYTSSSVSITSGRLRGAVLSMKRERKLRRELGALMQGENPQITGRGLPYLCMEADYSPSDSARITLRVQALFETVQKHITRK